MSKLFKYEMKDTSSALINTILIVVIFNLLVFAGVYFLAPAEFTGKEVQNDLNGFSITFGILGIGVIISYLLNIGLIITSFAYGIYTFRKDLYTDSGLLIMTIPKSGVQILAAKFLTALTQFLVLTFISCLFLVLQTLNLSSITKGPQGVALVDSIMSYTFGSYDVWIAASVLTLFVFSWFTLASYLAIASAKSFVRSRKLRWLVTLGVITGIFAADLVLSMFLERLFPFSFNVTDLLSGSRSVMSDLSLYYASMIFEVFVLSAMFMGTAYLLERKVEV